MISKIERLILTLLLALCFGCSGGGGGGSGTGSTSSASKGIRVLHSAIDAPPVDLSSDATPGTVLQSSAFGNEVGYVKLPSGQQTLEVSLRGIDGEILPVPVLVEGNERRSILLFEASGSTDYNTALFDDLTPELQSGQAAVRIMHGIRKVELLSVSINGTDIGETLPRAGATSYQTVSAGTVNIQVSSTSGSLYSGAVVLEDGRAYTLLLAGEAGYLVLGRLLNDS